jgi:F0F1-type ATP synthase membrane subunit c/vacuolar-type H+-ATPase subunit K
MRRNGILALLAALTLALGAPGCGSDKGGTWKATMSGALETPPNTSTATGTALLETNESANGVVRFTVSLTGIQGVTAGHIHGGGPGSAGPVIVTLLLENPPLDVPANATQTIDGMFNEADILPNTVGITTLKQLKDEMDAGNCYVNIHTVANPGGEIRGQIQKSD